MAGRLDKPGVDVFQILENRKPTAFRPVLVPVIVGTHKNIQYNQPLVYHYAGNAEVGTIPTGNSAIVQQTFENSSDISVFIDTDRGLVKLTETDDYAVELDGALGVENKVTLQAKLLLTKKLIDDRIASSITLNTLNGVNYITIEDAGAAFPSLGVMPGDKVTIDFSTSSLNDSADFTVDLVVSVVDNPSVIKCTFTDNNALWTDEINIAYDIDTPEMRGEGTPTTIDTGATLDVTVSYVISQSALKIDTGATTLFAEGRDWLGATLVFDTTSYSIENLVTYSMDDTIVIGQRVTDTIAYGLFENKEAPFASEWVGNDVVSLSSYTYGTYQGVAGQVYTSYNEATVINDVNKVVEINGVQDIKDNFGTLEPENPLGYHALMGAIATDRTFFAVRAASDDVEGFEVALDSLKLQEDAYFIVPASQDDNVISLCQTHVDFMSDPYQKGERVALVSKTIPEYDIIESPVTNGAITVPNPADATTTVTYGENLEDARPGHILRVEDNQIQLLDGTYIDNLKNKLVILDVIGATSLKVAGQIAKIDGAAVDGSEAMTWAVTTPTYQKGEKARIAAEKAASFDNKRVVNIYPDIVEASVTRTVQEAPHYAAVEESGLEDVNASVAAFCVACHASALQPVQPQTNITVPGIASAVGSNDELSADNLDVISGGGNWILMNKAGSVSTRHQLTTAVSDVTLREFSVVKSIDYAAKVFRNYLNPLVGKSIITDSFIKKVVWPTASAALHALTDGGQLSAKSSVMSIYQNEDDPTRITLEIDVVPLYPANYFSVKLFI